MKKLFTVNYIFRGRDYVTVVKALTPGDAINAVCDANPEIEVVHVQEE